MWPLLLSWLQFSHGSACLSAHITGLPVGFRSSAGVFRHDRLLATLWSGVTLATSSAELHWDGVADAVSDSLASDEQCREAAAAGMYVFRVLANNFTYEWQGVIGNTGPMVGPDVYRGLNPIISISVAGNTLAFTQGYAERERAFGIFDTASPGTPIPLGHDDYHRAFTLAATDGRVAYFANTGCASRCQL
jgi:hypothetical protein